MPEKPDPAPSAPAARGPAIDPIAAVKLSQQVMRIPLRKRFYEAVSVAPADGGFGLLLDRRRAKTPGGAPFTLGSLATAEIVAAEWAAQGAAIDPVTMPATRIAHSALDGVRQGMAAVRGEIVNYARSDLVCYRAETPAMLAQREAAAWDPVIAFARDALGAQMRVTAGIVHAPQPDAAIAAVARAVAAHGDPLALAALSTITTLTGSALLALAVAQGRFGAQEAWAAAHVDEDFQAELWGGDDEALARRAARWVEMQAAAKLLGACGAKAAT